MFTFGRQSSRTAQFTFLLVTIICCAHLSTLITALECHNCITEDYNQDEDDYEECLKVEKLRERLKLNKEKGQAGPLIKISGQPELCITMETQVTNRDGDVIESVIVRTQINYDELSRLFLLRQDVGEFCDGVEGSLTTFQQGSEQVHVKICGCTTDICNARSGQQSITLNSFFLSAVILYSCIHL